MDDNIHVVATSVLGKTRGFTIARRRLKSILYLTGTLTVFLSVAGFAGLHSSAENLLLHAKVIHLQKNLADSQKRGQEYQERLAAQETEKEELMQNALAELDKRSKAIESILGTVGVDIKIEEDGRDTGGPFTSPMEQEYETLTLRVDQYLEAIQYIPLGAPVPGTITSRFGKRPDPFNRRMAFHEGIDIRNRTGTPVMATADGVVSARGYNQLSGNYLVLDHGKDFRTRFLHLQKSVVKHGQQISRGQVIGHLGNTGRSTGPHLHYEIQYLSNAVDPIKFMRIASYISLDEATLISQQEHL
jgi:murein DD-endopeptidase MepM/ murein hydrolase activator NlpD